MEKLSIIRLSDGQRKTVTGTLETVFALDGSQSCYKISLKKEKGQKRRVFYLSILDYVVVPESVT